MSAVRKRGGKHSYYIDLGVIDKESIQKEKGGLAAKKYMGEINVFEFCLTKIGRAVFGVVLAAVVAAGVVGNANDATKLDKKEPVISNPIANVNDMLLKNNVYTIKSYRWQRTKPAMAAASRAC